MKHLLDVALAATTLCIVITGYVVGHRSGKDGDMGLYSPPRTNIPNPLRR